MKTKPSINEVLANPELLNHDGCWSYYDWFCPTRSLESRAKALLPKLKFLVEQGLIDGDNNYVWFKNNSPFSGTTYDDMRFCSLKYTDEEGHNLFLGGLAPASGHYYDKFKCTIWALYDGNFSQDATNWSEMKKVLKDKDSYLYKLVKKCWSYDGKNHKS